MKRLIVIALALLVISTASEAGVYRHALKPACVKSLRVSGHALVKVAKLAKKAAY